MNRFEIKLIGNQWMIFEGENAIAIITKEGEQYTAVIAHALEQWFSPADPEKLELMNNIQRVAEQINANEGFNDNLHEYQNCGAICDCQKKGCEHCTDVEFDPLADNIKREHECDNWIDTTIDGDTEENFLGYEHDIPVHEDPPFDQEEKQCKNCGSHAALVEGEDYCFWCLKDIEELAKENKDNNGSGDKKEGGSLKTLLLSDIAKIDDSNNDSTPF
jgi:hypothetical protein